MKPTASGSVRAARGCALPEPGPTRQRPHRPARARSPLLAAWLALPLLAAAPLAAAPGRTETWTGIERLPGHPPVLVKVEGDARVYFRATPEQPLVVPLRGPARLRVVSRAELLPGTEQPVGYRVRVSTGRKRLEQQTVQTVRSADATLGRRAPGLGQSRQMIVQVPQGDHALRISVSGTPAVLLRLLRAEPAARREEMVALTPFDAPRSVSLKEYEKLLPYYSALPGRPVRYRVVGPTTLDVMTRLDFDLTMRGTQSYRLAISDDGAAVREVEYRTTKALTAIYPDLSDHVPGKFRRLRLPIGKGVHVISIALVRPKQGSVEVRALIPQPAVGNTE